MNSLIGLSTNGNEFSDKIKCCQLVNEIQEFMKWVCTIKLENTIVQFDYSFRLCKMGNFYNCLTFY